MLLAEPAPSRQLFENRTPFTLGTEEPLDIAAKLEGSLPAWLKGSLIRTCPALFETGSWRAEHWFDGLGMLYAFRIAPDAVRYQQRLLASSSTKQLRQGPYKPGGFATRTTRSLLRRIFEPVPEITDNTNVNILPMGDDLVAMTESTRQLSIDRASLDVRGEVAYTDGLGQIIMSAHPQWDVARNKVVNVGSRFGSKSAILIYEHDVAGRERKVVAEWRSSRLPYVHAFGLTAKKAVVIAHPLTVNPLSLLWSNGGYIDHFRWRASDGTKLLVADRATGVVREHHTDAMFVFHVIHAFDDGADTVLDVVAYDDPSVVDSLRRGALANTLPEIAPKPVRLRINDRGVTREALGDVGFEFPVVHYKRASGANYRFAWGASLGGGDWRSTIHRLDTVTHKTTSFHEPGWIFGEPVFVAEPKGEREGQGVLVSVGTDGKRSAMLTLDAESLAVHAWAYVDTAIPLGFHGSFVR
jgi:beta,beta-carotene 9',10'-dioxygenase